MTDKGEPMGLDEEFDLIEEKQEDDARDILHEQNMHADVEYALEDLGANEITETLEEISVKLSSYGHQFSVRDILDYIGLTDER